jgi:hypothetical protein
MVIFWPTVIARNVMHPCLHALNYGKVIPEMWQVLNGLIRPIVNPSARMFISNVTQRTTKFEICEKGCKKTDLPRQWLLPMNSFHA